MNHELAVKLTKIRESLKLENLTLHDVQQLLDLQEKWRLSSLEETISRCVDKAWMDLYKSGG